MATEQNKKYQKRMHIFDIGTDGVKRMKEREKRMEYLYNMLACGCLAFTSYEINWYDLWKIGVVINCG